MSLKRNVLANYAGQLWTALVGLAFIPLYIQFLGIEAYGMIGVFATLQALVALLDLGLGHTVNREMARLSGRGTPEQLRDMLRTLEVPYWAVAAFIGVLAAGIAPALAKWVNVGVLSVQNVEAAVLLMGLSIAFKWPSALYAGVLMGLQKQVLFNALSATIETVRAIGAVVVLWLVSPTLQAFFLWQAFVAVVSTCIFGWAAWRALPPSPVVPHFRSNVLSDVWRFAAGVTGISLSSTVLMQLDKVILSRMLSLESFGFYALANVVSLTLYRLFGPIFSAVYPRFTELLAAKSPQALAKLYHETAQLLAVAVLPAAMILVVFSREIMLIWTRDPNIADNTWLLVSILTFGTALNGLLHIPYGIQLAAGWTRLTLVLSISSVIVVCPLMVFMASLYGAAGAASVWVVLNIGLVFCSMHFMHRRLLTREKWRWYVTDAGLPLLTALAVAGLFRWAMPDVKYLLGIALYVVVASAATLAITALATPFTRRQICLQLAKRRLA